MKEFVDSQHVWYRIIKWCSITPCPPNNGNAQMAEKQKRSVVFLS